ncbi:sensor histidine kinase [Streptomyces sp. NPDC001758]
MEGARLAGFGRGCLLWAALALPVLAVDRLGLNEPRPLRQQIAGLAVLALATAAARSRPLAAFGLTAVLSLASAPALFSLSFGPALAVLALLLGLRAASTAPAALCFAAVGCAGTVKIVFAGLDPVPQWLVLTGTLLFDCVFPWLGGRYWRQSRELTAAGWSRAARLEEEQRLSEDRARLRERARIAQDMHDSLGHELSLIALRAGALQVAPDLRGHHRAAAADLRAAAADATERLHRIIGVLREGDDEPVPLAPAGENVEQLVARAAESGLPVRWEADARGTAVTPGGAAERLLHRVAREALTHAARHAPGAPVVVAVTGDETRGATVTVTNGRPDGGSPAVPGGGSGLSGLRAAVTAAGGTLDAGPYEEGYRVSAHVPAQAATAVRSSHAPSAPFTRARAVSPPVSVPPPVRASSWSVRASAGTPTPRRTRCWSPRRTPHCARAHRTRTSRRCCRTGTSRTRRPNGRPPRPRTPTAVTTGRAASSSSPSTTSGSVSTTRAVWRPRT